jgi:hypothetical protein
LDTCLPRASFSADHGFGIVTFAEAEEAAVVMSSIPSIDSARFCVAQH